MSAKIMGEVYDLDLPGNEQAVLLALADHAAHDGSKVFPSNGLVAWKLGISDDTVARMKKKLIARKILIVVNQQAGRSTEYRIDISAGKKKLPYNPPQIAEGMNQPPSAELCGNHPPQNAAPPSAELCGTNHQEEPSNKPSKESLPDEAVLWNEICSALPKVLNVSPARLQKIRMRRTDNFWTKNFRNALEKVAESNFCCGHNDRQWTATFDWLLQPDTVTRIMEGKYDNRGKQTKASTAENPFAALTS